MKSIHGRTREYCHLDQAQHLTLPWHHRLYFFVRRMIVRILRSAIRGSVWLHWPWAGLQLRQAQRRLGLRFER